MTRLQTAIWREEPEATDPFAVRRARCHGYDWYGDMLGHTTWAEMMLVLFTGERPSPGAAALFNDLAVVLANPGPRDPSVNAAMSGAVGRPPAAATLIAALAAGAGQGGGGRDVLLTMTAFAERGTDLAAWEAGAAARPAERDDVWPAREGEPGFEPHAARRAGITSDALGALARHAPAGGALSWLVHSGEQLERAVGRPLALSGVAAAAFTDLGLRPEQGEMLTLLLRLPGAAAHALEQGAGGYKAFPFPAIELLDDPLRKAAADPAAAPTPTTATTRMEAIR